MPIHANNHPLIQLNQSETAMLERVQALVTDKIGPNANAVGREDVFAWDTFRLLASEGVIGTGFPSVYGGTDATMALRVRIIETLAGVCSTAASLITGTDLSARPIVAGASDALKQDIIPDIVSGKRQSAFALTEPSAGSDVARLASTFTGSAATGYRISGSKKFITRANTANMFVAVARRAVGLLEQFGDLR